MPDFVDPNELEAYIMEQLKEVMDNDVANEVKEVLQKHVQEDVYDKYDPTMYLRTKDLYNDIAHLTSSVKMGVTLEVWDDATQSGINRGNVYIPEIIEYGHWKSSVGYEIYSKEKGTNTPAAYLFPRPFIELAQVDLETNKQHVDALREGLSRFFDIE